MKTEDKLDAVLSALDHSEIYPENYDQIKSRLSIDMSQKELGLILNKLADDNYVTIQHATSDGKSTNDKFFQITFHGLLFSGRGGFKSETKRQKQRKYWTIAKTIAAFANAIMIILISIWAVCVTKNDQTKEMEVIEEKEVKQKQT